MEPEPKSLSLCVSDVDECTDAFRFMEKQGPSLKPASSLSGFWWVHQVLLDLAALHTLAHRFSSSLKTQASAFHSALSDPFFQYFLLFKEKREPAVLGESVSGLLVPLGSFVCRRRSGGEGTCHCSRKSDVRPALLLSGLN